jgi:DNA helicase-2/ATP-dependent DNA helicase PcrA
VEACSDGKILSFFVSAPGSLIFAANETLAVRFNALSRAVEAALQKEGIPNRVLAGQKFFERLEVYDISLLLRMRIHSEIVD